MAIIDYLGCAVCGCKTIYDANVDYKNACSIGRLGDLASICLGCSKSHALVVVEKPTVNPINDKVYKFIKDKK